MLTISKGELCHECGWIVNDPDWHIAYHNLITRYNVHLMKMRNAGYRGSPKAKTEFLVTQ